MKTKFSYKNDDGERAMKYSKTINLKLDLYKLYDYNQENLNIKEIKKKYKEKFCVNDNKKQLIFGLNNYWKFLNLLSELEQFNESNNKLAIDINNISKKNKTEITAIFR